MQEAITLSQCEEVPGSLQPAIMETYDFEESSQLLNLQGTTENFSSRFPFSPETSQIIIPGPSVSTINAEITQDCPINAEITQNSLPTPSTHKAHSRPKKRKREDDNEVGKCLINAINKITEQDEVGSLVTTFVKYTSVQITQLLTNKPNSVQRRIRFRINNFLEELLDEFSED